MTLCTGLRLAGTCLALSFLAAAQQFPNAGSYQLRASTESSIIPKPQLQPLTPEMRGDVYMARKMYREAIDMYREAPETAGIENKIGIAFHQMLQFGLAKQHYEAAVRLKPTFADAINNLGTIYYSQKQYKKAVVYYKRSLRYSGDVASVYVNIGAAYFARRDYKKASTYYERALALDPDVFERRGEYGTFMEERTADQLAVFHLYLAKTYAKNGRKDRALMYLRKALEEGVHDRKKIPDMPEFAQLKDDPQFQELLALNPKPL